MIELNGISLMMMILALLISID